MRQIGASQLRQALAASTPPAVLDVRRRDAFDAARIPGATWCVSDDVAGRAPDVIGGLDTPVVVYCGSARCRRSVRAVERLERLGYRAVYRYEGGLEDWRRRGLPVESSRSRRGR